MSNDVVIRVENLWKQYRYGSISHATLHKDLQSWWARIRGKEDPNSRIGMEQRAKRKAQSSNSMPSALSATRGSEGDDRFWALRDINFEVKQGEVLGIIGRNGAGKSTLLKIMSRVTTPTRGEIKIKGRVASLLEVGTGFHPELTGRENIFLNGAILGMTKDEIKRKFDEIVAFAEVENFIDTPVKRYSSGMYVRLAFAVAAHLEPEILIVDEVLAVGDAQFQTKCLGKMGEVAKEGRTVLFVSHNMAAVRTLCQSGLVFERGALQKIGTAEESVAFYGAKNLGGATETWVRPVNMRSPTLSFEHASCQLHGRQPDLTLVLNLKLISSEHHKPAFLAIDIMDVSDTPLMQAIPKLEGFIEWSNSPHSIQVKVDLPPLIPGQYFITLWVGSHYDSTETLDYLQGVLSFEITESPSPGRTFPHHPNHGHIVPRATLDR